jgi:NTE family protein
VQHAGILAAVISARAVGSLRGVFTFLIAVLWLAIMSGASAQNAAGGASLAGTQPKGQPPAAPSPTGGPPSSNAPTSAPAAADHGGPGDLNGPAGPHRPRIGLVLSGGGARGAAHIGVLKVLEELHIPIDAIAGTSMGAVVGGLYASGLSAREIESIMTSLNWQDAFSDRPSREDLTFRRKEEDENFLVKFPLGLRGRHIQLPKGLIQGQKLNQMLRRLTLPVAHITNFDDLPTPFRAVATDLETGDAVIMNSGDLTTAMRASLSAPGVFAPVQRDGRLLVDGGISENIPIDVARRMGVDILIVVDVGFPLLKRDKLNSVPVISNQMLAILIQKNSRQQLATLTKSDIVIEPQLGDTSSFDFGIFNRIISAGEIAARESESKLVALADTPGQFQQYVARRDEGRRPAPRIDFVRIDAGSEQRYAHRLERLFSDVVGKPLDPDQVARHVTTVYGQGNLESLDYRVVRDPSTDEYGLALNAQRNSWGPNYVRFGLSLQDDFQGTSSYDAAARIVMSEITAPGGELVGDLQIGEDTRVGSDVYLPLSETAGWFVDPHILYEARNLDVPLGQVSSAEYRVRTFNYGLDFGYEFGNWGEIRTGVEHEEGHSRVEIGDPTLPQQTFNTRSVFVRMSYDRLDDVNFPHRGQQASFEWDAERRALGSDQDSDRIEFSYLGAVSFGRYTGVFSAAGGTTLNTPDIAQSLPGGIPADVQQLFTLGGFLNLSGLKANSLSGPHYGIARTLFYKQIGRGGPGYLDVPTYLGVSFEMGNVWAKRSDASFSNTHRDESIFLGMDTFLGPVYIATGFDDKGRQAFYLFLGRTF